MSFSRRLLIVEVLHTTLKRFLIERDNICGARDARQLSYSSDVACLIVS